MPDNRDDRERLAEASFRKRAAAHKGRPHSYAHQRRRQAAKRLAEAKTTERARVGRMRRLKDQIAAYWRGEREDHP